MCPIRIDLHKIPQNSPDDLAGLKERVESGEINPAQIMAVLGKTEGNGCVNDFTRGFATQTLKSFLDQQIGAVATANIVFIMSGGTEGVLSPHLNVFTRQDDPPGVPQRWGLVMGTSQTRPFLPEEIGLVTMVQVVAAAVNQAVEQAG